VIGCECYRDRDDVLRIGYLIYDNRGYLVDILQPIIDARDDIKAIIRYEQQQDVADRERLVESEGLLQHSNGFSSPASATMGSPIRSLIGSSATRQSIPLLARSC